MRGPNYHWVADLYKRLNLPVMPAVVQALHKAIADRVANLEKQKTEKQKQQRVHMKVSRAEDQEARKKWVKQQPVRHTYGQEDYGDEGEGNLVRHVGEMIGNEDEVTLSSGRKC